MCESAAAILKRGSVGDEDRLKFTTPTLQLRMPSACTWLFSRVSSDSRGQPSDSDSFSMANACSETRRR